MFTNEDNKGNQQASADNNQNTDHQAELDKLNEQLEKARFALAQTEKDIERKKREAKMAKEGLDEDSIRAIVREESESLVEQIREKEEEASKLRDNLGTAMKTLTDTQRAVQELRKSLDSKESKAPAGGEGGQKPPPPPQESTAPELAPWASKWIQKNHVWDPQAVDPKTGKKGAWVPKATPTKS